MKIPWHPARKESPVGDDTGNHPVPEAPKAAATAPVTRLRGLMNIQSAWLARRNARMADES